jgi:putative hydrolase of the HAD superfamily
VGRHLPRSRDLPRGRVDQFHRRRAARCPRPPPRRRSGAAIGIRALVFDFDGLILETETPAYQAWVEIYREFGHELPKELWLDYIGREGGWFDALAYLEGLVGGLDERDAVEARRDARKTELVMAVAETAGLRALLGDARSRGLRLGVCSSSTPKWVFGHLDRLGLLSDFDHIQCRDRPELRAKPAPDLYLASCAGLGVRGEEAIAFEDSRNGMLAAQAAGMRCVVVPNELTVAMDLAGADHRFESLAAVSLQMLLDAS